MNKSTEKRIKIKKRRHRIQRDVIIIRIWTAIKNYITLPFRALKVLFTEGFKGIEQRILYRLHLPYFWGIATRLNLWERIFDEKPVAVFQMGKVGSKTVDESVAEAYRKRGKKVPVIHVHVLNNFDKIEKGLIAERGLGGGGFGAIRNGRILRNLIEKNPSIKWNVITLVREPVARNVGAFFQNLWSIIPDWRERYAKGNLTIEELQKVFISAMSVQNAPVAWFDEQLKPVFYVDVFSIPFPAEQGYYIYPETIRGRVLLIRLEDLNRIGPHAIKEFLELDEFELHNINIGENKEYAEIYKAFKSKPLPLDYVQKTYEIKVATHFYTPAEIAEFTRRWTK